MENKERNPTAIKVISHKHFSHRRSYCFSKDCGVHFEQSRLDLLQIFCFVFHVQISADQILAEKCLQLLLVVKINMKILYFQWQLFFEIIYLNKDERTKT